MGYINIIVQIPQWGIERRNYIMAKCSNPKCKCINCTCGENCTCTGDKCNCPPECNMPKKEN